jgi:hypothetical protein
VILQVLGMYQAEKFVILSESRHRINTQLKSVKYLVSGAECNFDSNVFETDGRLLDSNQNDAELIC